MSRTYQMSLPRIAVSGSRLSGSPGAGETLLPVDERSLRYVPSVYFLFAVRAVVIICRFSFWAVSNPRGTKLACNSGMILLSRVCRPDQAAKT